MRFVTANQFSSAGEVERRSAASSVRFIRLRLSPATDRCSGLAIVSKSWRAEIRVSGYFRNPGQLAAAKGCYMEKFDKVLEIC